MSHDPERMKKNRNYRKFMEEHGVPERRFHARLLEFKALGRKLRNPDDKNDEGARMIRAAARRHPVITADDFYRIQQLRAVFTGKSSLAVEPGNSDNWAWRTQMDEYATDMFMLMLPLVAIIRIPPCVGLNRDARAFLKQYRKQFTHAVKFRRRLLVE